MKKIVVYGTADGKFPEEYMVPEIFSTDNCDGMQIYDNCRGGIAVLQRSDNPCPMPWRMYPKVRTFSGAFYFDPTLTPIRVFKSSENTGK